MDLIGPELSELFALEFAKIAESELFTLYHLQMYTNEYQSFNMVTIYMTLRSYMS